MQTQRPTKSIVAFVFTFAAALLSQVQDKTEFTDLTALQWLVVVVSAAVTAGAVYVTTNKPTA